MQSSSPNCNLHDRQVNSVDVECMKWFSDNLIRISYKAV